MTRLTRQDERNLRQEYDNLRQSIWNRAQTTWLFHTIILSGSLLAVLASFQYNEILQKPLPLLPFEIPIGTLFPVAAIIAVIFSFFIQYTDLKLNDIMFQRMHEIEEQLGMTGPAEMFEANIKPKLWHKLRKLSWFILFAFLISSYIWVLLAWVLS